MKRILTLLLPLLFAPGLAARQDVPAPQMDAREVRAVRTVAPPVIDGDLSDEAWSAAPEITEFTQREPDELQPPTEATSVRIVYDEEAIYFGVRLDDRHPVTTVVARRDDSAFTDRFTVYLDPHHDRRSGASFTVSSANVQSDSVLFNDTDSEDDWDAVWSSATRVGPGGWTLEMRIPYSQLRFPRRETHVWGINLQRFIARRHENDWLVAAPRNESIRIANYAHLVGIEGIAPRRAVELVPYVVGRADALGTVKSNDPLNEPLETSLSGGLDVRFPLTSNLTLTGTINPDFGQVEVDPAVVNLSQFETFYPEKRPFFLEGATLFDFGSSGSNSGFGFNFGTPDLFYSRRIGREPQLFGRVGGDWIDAPQETTILGAAKITGKTASGWTIAVMDAVTDEESARWDLAGTRGRTTVEPLTNYLVARVARDLGNRGRLGAMVTSVHRDVDETTDVLRSNAWTAATDGYWAFGNRDVIWSWSLGGTAVEGSEEAIALTQTSSARYYDRPDATHVEFDPSRTSLSGWGGKTTVAKQTGNWRYNVQAESFSPGFESNDVGYMTRTDVTATHATLIYSNSDTTPRVRHRNFWLGKYQNWNHDSDLIANGIYGSGFVLLSNYWDISCSGGYGFEALDDRLTRGGPLALRPATLSGGCNGSTDSRKKLFVSFDASHDRSSAGTRYNGVEIGVRYRPLDNVTFSIEPEYSTSHTVAQFIRRVPDATASATYGQRYVFGELDQKVLEIGTRLDWTFNSRLTFQLYLQPFIAAGSYSDIKEFARPREYDFDVYGVDRGTIAFDPESNAYAVDPDGAGEGRPFSVRNPDFDIRSLRGSAVLRWEFRPGSALYVAWNENRARATDRGEFQPWDGIQEIFDAESDDVFLVKISYWLPL